jgi:hypothetical protein
MCWTCGSIAAIASGLLVAASLQANSAVINVQDYAYGSQLTIDGNAALYAVKLDADVYRRTARADLGDLHVINGLNEEVPFAIRRPIEERAAPAAFDPLPLFPLRRADRAPSDALKLRLRAAGAAIDLEQPSQKSDSNVTAYLLDIRGSDLPVAALRLQWLAETADFSNRLRVESSDDLTRWQVVDSGLPIVNLHYGGQSFVRAEAKLSAPRASFLRLSWLDPAPPDLILTAVTGQRQSNAIELRRQTLSVAGRSSSQPGEYEFDLGARVPVDRVNLKLPEPNTLVEAQFLARADESRQWQGIGSARLYRLKSLAADELSNPALSVNPTAARHWQARITTAGGIGSGMPTLEAGWLPDELLFLARGPAPFQLVYGNASEPNGVRVRLDAASLPTRDAPLEAHQAQLGPSKSLGGEGRLKAVGPPIDWKRWLLWGVLVAGVALLAAMAWKLARSLR